MNCPQCLQPGLGVVGEFENRQSTTEAQILLLKLMLTTKSQIEKRQAGTETE